jgi:hypothetical protein
MENSVMENSVIESSVMENSVMAARGEGRGTARSR